MQLDREKVSATVKTPLADLFADLPDFTQPRSIELADKKLFDAIFRRIGPETSEFTFTNLFCWSDAYGIKIGKLRDFLLICAHRDGELMFFAPLGQGEVKEAIIEVFRQYPQAKFIRLPEYFSGLFSAEAGFKLSEDRDNFDYLYRREDLAQLKGKRFDAKRNFIKRFYKQYNPLCRKATQDDIEHCVDFHNEWCDDKACDLDIGLKREKEAILKMLKNCHTLQILGAVIEIDAKVKAFSIGEALNNTTFVVHAEKASAKFTGIYQAINNFFASIIPQEFEFINREQDLGIDNLRKAKMSYQPAGFVKKYILSKA